MKKVLFLMVSMLVLGLFFTGCSDIANITTPSDVDSLEKNSSPVTWTGQGSNALTCELIGTSEERTEDGWIHWVLNGTKDVNYAQLVLGGSGSGTDPYEPTKYGSVLQFFTPYFDLDTLTADVNYSGSLKKNSQFVISDYCPGDSGEEPTTQYTLTVNIVGNGSVEVNDVLYTVPVTVDEGTVLGLEAIADSGWQFDGWTGDLVSSNATESITMNGNKAITANFSVFTYTSESCFNFNSSTGTVTGYICSGGDVSIPPTIGGTAVLAIGTQAFSMKSLTGILIPEGVTSIGSGAFVGNVLHSVIIPNSVTSIGNEAFNSIQLQSLTIGSGLTSIPYSGFAFNQLTSVTIPDNVTSIGQWAFAYNNLISVTIGSNVTSIGYYAFYGPNNKITQITIGANVTIDSNLATMGANPGFKTAYDNGGKLAGTYNYTGGVWVKE
ncbi:MAG TPA: leucine-rich repeat domain-containing protein [Candidatus Atribacteria bacterium]|nr:leucine-rich repeat domain-containing protein [Candidatus Atribacteria bacterium]